MLRDSRHASQLGELHSTNREIEVGATGRTRPVSSLLSTNTRRLHVKVPGEPVNRRRDFESAGPLFSLFVVTGARPSPIGRPLAQVPTDRVLVDVGHRGFNGLHRSEVSIIASPFLPESKTLRSGAFQNRQPFQQRAPSGFQESLDASRKRGLERFQEQVYTDVIGRRLNEDVNVLRHEDIGDQPARLTVERIIKAFRQEMAPFVVRQEWNAPVARERQLVAIARLVKSLDGFSMVVHAR